MSVTTASASPAEEGRPLGRSTLVVSTLAISLMSLALPITTLQLYDRILPNHSAGTLWVLVGGVLVVTALEAILRLCRAHLLGVAGAAYVHDLSARAMNHVLAADTSAITRKSSPIDFNSLRAIRNLKDFHNGSDVTTFVELLFVPVMLGVIWYVGGWLVVVPLILLVIFALLSYLHGRALKLAIAQRDLRDDERYSFLAGSLNAAHALKAFAQERLTLRRYEQLQGGSCVANFAVSDAMTASFNAGTLFSHLMTAATVAVGALAVLDEKLTVGALIAVILLAGRIMQPVQRALLLWARYQDYKVAREKVDRIFAAPVVLEAAAQEIPPSEGSLEIEGLTFGYSAEEPPIIDGLDLSLGRGEAVSITGGPGVGKTTLLKLVAGLHRPAGGRILVNGLEPTFFPPHSLNEQLGYMPTSATIFRGTIRDNITRFGDVPVAQAMFVARLMGVEEEIAALPAGLDTRLEGNGADSIPPGMKQRIALVRVLATKPRILLFDNADRGLDLEGYTKVYAMLGRLKAKVAMVIVSDDENLRRIADRHYELEDGRLHQLAGASSSVRNPSSRIVRL